MAIIIEKSLLKTEAIFSQDKKSRYLLRKEWDKNKERATILIIKTLTGLNCYGMISSRKFQKGGIKYGWWKNRN